MDEKRAVLVTTKHRGVFFGYLNGDPPSKEEVTIDRARMCVYWSSDVRGVMGLASGGPTNSCRVTHALPEPVTLYDVTMVADCSAEAVEAWEQGPWS